MKKEFKFEIKKHYGTVSTSEDGKYSTEVNLISTGDEAETLGQILLGIKEKK